MAVYSYLRVSTGRQAAEGESLGAQERRVEGYAMMHGLKLEQHYVERGVSGSIPMADRPEGARLLAVLQAGDIIITPKLDRAFRSANDALAVLERLKGLGVALHMIDLGGDVNGNGMSKLVFTILSAVAEAERDRIRERIGEVKADQKKRGRYLGGKVPFGFAKGEDGALVEVEAEQVAIREIKMCRTEGKALRSISATMLERGIKISHQGVAEVLARA